jgi:hypothetical protein
MVTVGGEKYDIGANPSTEGGEDETVDDSAALVNNVVNAFRLQETSFDKKAYIGHIKEYMKSIKAHLESTGSPRAQIFEKNAQTFVKKLLDNFSDYSFFQGESFCPEGMVVLMGYRENGTTPYMIYFKDGMKAQKY